jgi:hypothetical protein
LCKSRLSEDQQVSFRKVFTTQKDLHIQREQNGDSDYLTITVPIFILDTKADEAAKNNKKGTVVSADY